MDTCKKKHGLNRGKYNQIANFVIAQSEINIAIGDTPPSIYFVELIEQINGGEKRYGGITEEAQLRKNYEQNCLPEYLLKAEVPDYDTFLSDRRHLMALRVKEWFEALSRK